MLTLYQPYLSKQKWPKEAENHQRVSRLFMQGCHGHSYSVMYKVLTPSITTPIYIFMGLLWEVWEHLYIVWLFIVTVHVMSL